jgi:lysophospholipase L1-like esterase
VRKLNGIAFRIIFFALLSWPVIALAGEDFAIRDGDTVVFLGDSITAAHTYGKIIEECTLLRYPNRNVRFINAGVGGDTAEGGLKRLQRDVLSKGATLVTVAYGINDIGWGTKADEQHRKLYLDSIRGIVEACKGADDYLQQMCNDGMAIARSAGEGAIDVMGTMRTIQQRVRKWNDEHPEAKDSLHVSDGVHLSDLGQLAMGFAILKGLGAPADVSSATIAAGTTPQLIDSAGCKISDMSGTADHIEFIRTDEGLPLNLNPLWQLQFRFIPIPDELNRYMLSIRDLPEGQYDVTASGRLVGTWSAQQLSAGVNIASATPNGWFPGGPWDAQAHLLKRLTDARDDTVSDLSGADQFLKDSPNYDSIKSDLAALNESIRTSQKNIAKPVPYRFVVQRSRPTTEPAPK